MRIRKAFTMIELVFAIVIMGILAKFGVEFLARAYESFIFSSTNNKLQSNSATAVEFIANRLQYRIKDSVIVRETPGSNTFVSLTDALPNTNYRVIEWISADIDGFRGTNNPLWSGILDLDAGQLLGTNTLVSPVTNTNSIDTLIKALSNNQSGINDAALYFIGNSNQDFNSFGWIGNGHTGALTNQTSTMHPIQSVPAQITQFTSSVAGDFAGVTVLEYYKLAWTANAIVIVPNGTMWNLEFYYDYQPWSGEKFNSGGTIKHFTLMNDISTFQAMAIGSIIKIQVCAKSDLIEDYSLCKEKTIY